MSRLLFVYFFLCCLFLLLFAFASSEVSKKITCSSIDLECIASISKQTENSPKGKVNIAKQAFVDPFVFRLLAYQNNCVIFQVFINRQNPVFSLPLDLHFFIFLQNSVDQRHLKILKINYFINIMCPNVELKGKEVKHNILCVHVIVYLIVLHHLSFSSGRRIKLKFQL